MQGPDDLPRNNAGRLRKRRRVRAGREQSAERSGRRPVGTMKSVDLEELGEVILEAKRVAAYSSSSGM